MKALAPARPPKVSPASDDLSSAWRHVAHCRSDELSDMDGCYSRLRRLVPTIPQGKKVTRMEILQHAIDYILDLQCALDAHPSVRRRRRGRSPLMVLNLEQFQAASVMQKQEESALCACNVARWCAES